MGGVLARVGMLQSWIRWPLGQTQGGMVLARLGTPLGLWLVFIIIEWCQFSTLAIYSLVCCNCT